MTAQVKPGADGPELIGFNFVETGGRPGHEGMFPIDRPVRAAEKFVCSVNLSGTGKDLHVSFVAKDGSPIRDYALQATGGEEYAGDCVVPSSPFRVAVAGLDAKGKPFRRIERPLRVPVQQ